MSRAKVETYKIKVVNIFMCLRVNMEKFEVQIEGCMGYIAFWG